MFNSYFDITRGYIPLKSPFCWLNPIKPPLNHHFPMGFLRFSTIFTTSELHRTFVASDLQQPGLHPISRAPAGGQAPVLARATAEPHRDHGPKAAAEVEAASFLHIIYYVYIYMKNIYILYIYIYIYLGEKPMSPGKNGGLSSKNWPKVEVHYRKR